MQDHSKLFNIFQKFCSEIKTQSGKTTHILHNDRAKEGFAD